MARPKYESYNIENWKNKNQQVLVKRDKLGHFIKWELFNAYRGAVGVTGSSLESTHTEISYTSWGVHSNKKNGKPNYYGFIIYGYATKPETIKEYEDKLSSKLKQLIANYLSNIAGNRGHWNWEQVSNGEWISAYIGIAIISPFPVDKNVLHTWEFKAEHNGLEVDSDSGNLEDL